MKFNNNYFILRHGESLMNVRKISSCWSEKKKYPLTKKGRKEVERSAGKLKNKKIDLIFASDLLRTKQTAEIVGKALGLKPKFDKRLREVNVGIFNGRPVKEAGEAWNQKEKLSPLEHYSKRFKMALPKGESYKDIEKRINYFLDEVDKKYKNKNILIVSHGRPITLFEKIVHNYDIKKFVKIILEKKEIKTGEFRKLCH
jgi:broad specificity phosphatase PhoE